MGAFGWLEAINIATELYGAYSHQSAARQANRTNVKLQREQQAWEQQMSNTAVQRRAADIEAAGGNRALAFVNGSEATTPTVTPARVEPAPFRANLASALLTATQLKNVQANTKLTEAKADQEEQVADWMKSPDMREGGTLTHFQTEKIAKLVKTKMDAITAENTKDLSAAQLDQYKKASDAVVQSIQQQAEKGKIELEQIKAVIENFGLGAQQKATLLKSIMQLILPLFQK